jgi:hypothetical protein
MATGAAAGDAAALVAAVRDDPRARLDLASRFYDTDVGGRDIRRYRRAELAFMQWQVRRGLLSADGSRWWRSVNERLLRDAWEAERGLRGGEPPAGRPEVDRWTAFLLDPSPRAWYRAHNTSIVAGYLAHRDLVEVEGPLEQFFMDVALLRVLYADALLSNPRLALGPLAAAGRLFGDPRRRGTAVFLSLHNILPTTYPLPEMDLPRLLAMENRLGHLIDYGVILPRAQALYEHAAGDLDEPRLLELVREGRPAYAWPADADHAWFSRRSPRTRRLLGRLTGLSWR